MTPLLVVGGVLAALLLAYLGFALRPGTQDTRSLIFASDAAVR